MLALTQAWLAASRGPSAQELRLDHPQGLLFLILAYFRLSFLFFLLPL